MDKAIITTSWDDGHPLDLRLAELLQKHGVPATFYIPLANTERECMNAQEIREIAQSFDVGGHAYHHVNLKRLSPEKAQREIIEGKKGLEDIIGRELSSFCYPYGKFNREVINLVKEAGFTGSRTTKLFTRSLRNPFKMGTTVYARNIRLLAYVKHSALSLDPGLCLFTLRNNLFFEDWEQIAVETLDFVIRHGGVWHLWGHSWEIADNNYWRRLEEVLSRISTLPKEVLKVNNSQLLRMGAGRQEGRVA